MLKDEQTCSTSHVRHRFRTHVAFPTCACCHAADNLIDYNLTNNPMESEMNIELRTGANHALDLERPYSDHAFRYMTFSLASDSARDEPVFVKYNGTPAEATAIAHKLWPLRVPFVVIVQYQGQSVVMVLETSESGLLTVSVKLTVNEHMLQTTTHACWEGHLAPGELVEKVLTGLTDAMCAIADDLKKSGRKELKKDTKAV